MIVVDKKNLINGNTVLKPSNEPLRKKEKYDREKYKKLEESKKEALKSLKEKQRKKKGKVLKYIACVFVVGMTIIYRYNMIYENQRKIKNIKAEINTFRENNDNLKIELVKYNSISNVEVTAKEELDMVKPSRADIIYCDLKKNNFVVEKPKVEEKEENFMSKIKDFLF